MYTYGQMSPWANVVWTNVMEACYRIHQVHFVLCCHLTKQLQNKFMELQVCLRVVISYI
jgi:L-ribulose-5-phosphate 3-epimerase UlaE